MSEFEDLERELKSIRPKAPSAAFTARVADALGDSADLSFRRISSEEDKPAAGGKLWFFLPPSLALAASLVWMLFFWSSPSGSEESTSPAVDEAASLAGRAEDPNSPIHGVSLDELEAHSGMPTHGWSDPQVREFLLDRVDEGLIERPGYSPGRQVRYHYLDETLWMHPASNTRVISTTPRQEVIILDLDLY